MHRDDDQARPEEVLAGIIGDTIRASSTRAILAGVAKDLIGSWAEKGGIRLRIAPALQWVALKILKPGKINIGRGISASMGRLLTLWARKVNAEHASRPACHAASRGDAIEGFLSNTDFGEIREMVEGSDPYVLKTLEAFNERLWKYPAKVGSILGTLLAAVNTGIRSTREFLRPIEKNVGPDLLADMLLSLLKGLNAREAAELTNAFSEFIRRLHTGNYLLAKAGIPLFQVYLTELLKEALPAIDPVLIRKARVALAEDSQAVAEAFADSLSENPALLLEMISAYGSIRTPIVKGASRKVRLLEEIDQGALADATSKGLSDLDTYEIAELVNGFLRVINRIHEVRPEVFSNIALSISDSLDTREIKAAAAWVVPEFVQAARPLLVSIMPSLVSGLTDVLSSPEVLEDTQQREAIMNLKSVLLAGGER